MLLWFVFLRHCFLFTRRICHEARSLAVSAYERGAYAANSFMAIRNQTWRVSCLAVSSSLIVASQPRSLCAPFHCRRSDDECFRCKLVKQLAVFRRTKKQSSHQASTALNQIKLCLLKRPVCNWARAQRLFLVTFNGMDERFQALNNYCTFISSWRTFQSHR